MRMVEARGSACEPNEAGVFLPRFFTLRDVSNLRRSW
jgi:hypothetical protein